MIGPALQQEADRRDKEAGTYRTDIVSLFVGREVARRVAQEHGIGVPSVDAAQLPLIADAMRRYRADGSLAAIKAVLPNAGKLIATVKRVCYA